MKQFKAESKKLLDLVVNSIYTNREIFLRELISNASDALDKRRFMSLTDGTLAADFAIELAADKAARTLTISDNGVGMTDKELENNLGVIAASGTEAFKKQNESKDGEQLIGQFGVGFYSAFMVAERVTVVSRKAGESNAYKWESDGSSGFEITPAERADAGTSVIIKLKPTATTTRTPSFWRSTDCVRSLRNIRTTFAIPFACPSKRTAARTVRSWRSSPRSIP